MSPRRLSRLLVSTVLLLGGLMTGCGKSEPAPAAPESAPAKVTRTLTLGAYTTPREAYGKEVIPAFQKFWKEKTGEEVTFQESYTGSGAQARAIIGGFDADIAALSLEADIQQLVKAGLITHDWKAKAKAGMVTRSIVVMAVREGNPKGISTWDDLAKPGVNVLTPNVKTSGGAMWNIAAMYGAATRGKTAAPANDDAAAEKFLGSILTNVSIMDKGARESMVTFERGVGDVAITYENEVLVGKKSGQKYDYVVPPSTILIENPIALIDASVEKHGNRAVAEAFIDFVISKEAQKAFSSYGLRPVDEQVAQEVASTFPPVTDLFTIQDLGGWPAVTEKLFTDNGLYARALPNAGGGK